MPPEVEEELMDGIGGLAVNENGESLSTLRLLATACGANHHFVPEFHVFLGKIQH